MKITELLLIIIIVILVFKIRNQGSNQTIETFESYTPDGSQIGQTMLTFLDAIQDDLESHPEIMALKRSDLDLKYHSDYKQISSSFIQSLIGKGVDHNSTSFGELIKLFRNFLKEQIELSKDKDTQFVTYIQKSKEIPDDVKNNIMKYVEQRESIPKKDQKRIGSKGSPFTNVINTGIENTATLTTIIIEGNKTIGMEGDEVGAYIGNTLRSKSIGSKIPFGENKGKIFFAMSLPFMNGESNLNFNFKYWNKAEGSIKDMGTRPFKVNDSIGNLLQPFQLITKERPSSPRRMRRGDLGPKES